MIKKILIIDDDSGFREIVRTTLLEEIPEIIIEEARDGHIGEKKLKENAYDLILLDYNLPFFMNGLRFLAKTEKSRFDTPTIMITGAGNEDVAAKAFRLGVTDYLVKTRSLLVKLIKTVEEILSEERDWKEYKSANLDNANSGIELVQKYQEALDDKEIQDVDQGPLDGDEDSRDEDQDNLDTEQDSEDDPFGDAVMVEFEEVGEFNKFSSYVKRMDGVRVQDVKVLENRFVLMLSLLPGRFRKMGKTFTSV